jgi:hypothetical protein
MGKVEERRAKYWIFFFNHNSTFNVLTRMGGGGKVSVKKIPRLIANVPSAQSRALR